LFWKLCKYKKLFRSILWYISSDSYYFKKVYCKKKPWL